MSRNRTTFCLLAVFAFNLFLRLLPFNQVFTGGNIILVDGDSYYHMRRILLIAENFPHVPVFDYYLNFPAGAKPPWPPLYDFFVASIAFLAGFGAPAVSTVETVAAVLPPVLGALTVVPLFYLARRLFDEKIALWGTFFFSLVPGHIWYTYIGRPDHHAIEPLILTVFSLSLIASVQGHEKRKYPSLLPALGGAILTAGMLVWTGSIIYLAAALFSFFPLAVMRSGRGVSLSPSPVTEGGKEEGDWRSNEDKDATPVFKTIILTSSTAALLLSLYLVLTGTWEPYSYITLSGFHALVIFFVAVFSVTVMLVFRVCQKRDIHRSYLILAAFAALVSLSLLFFFLFPEIRQSLSDGIFKQIGKSVPWRKVVSESRPLFSESTVGGTRFSFRNGVEIAGFGILFVPFALLLLLFDKKEREKKVLFSLLALVFIGLALNQMRYIYYASLFIGILTAYMMCRFMELIPGTGYALLAVVAFTTLFQPAFEKSFQFMLPSRGATINRMGPDGYETLLWLRQHTPEAGDYMAPVPQPHYSIMNAWSYGHEISYISRRPAVADNFAETLGGSGFFDSLTFFTTASAGESYAVMEKHASRYVLTEHPVSLAAVSLRMLGRKMPGYFTDDWKLTEKAIKDLVISRLYLFDGNHLDRYRLVYESASPVQFRPERFSGLRRYKIFEFVKGARLKGTSRPGSTVTATVPLISNRKREFMYETTADADGEGAFEIVLPYSTEGSPYQVKAKQGYTVNAGGRRTMKEVLEDDVISGRELYVN